MPSTHLQGSYDITWAPGDIIGVGANLDAGSLSFAQNGEWVEVFTACDFGAEGLFPSITGDGIQYEVNLGATPFQFAGPDEGYVPVSAEPKTTMEPYRGSLRYDFAIPGPGI